MSKSSKAKRKAKREIMRAAVMHNCKMHTQEGGLANARLSRTDYAYRIGLSGADMPAWIASDRQAKVLHVPHHVAVGRGDIREGYITVIDFKSSGTPGAFMRAYNRGKRDGERMAEQTQAAQLEAMLKEECIRQGMVPTAENVRFMKSLAQRGTI